MNRPSLFLRVLPPAMLALCLLGVYLATLAPGLTWANSGADGGDLITAAATGGVPHPTGYPVYLLLAGFFQHLPIGPLAFRTNLLSALTTVAAALLMYESVARHLTSSGAWVSRLAGLGAAFAFGLSPLVWSQAVITEVYSLHSLFLAAILYLASGLSDRFHSRQVDTLLGLLFGLSLGNHITTLFLLPVVFLPVLKEPASLTRRILFTLLGLTPYLILPLRALSGSPVNWGNASTPDGFFWLVTGDLYQDELTSLTMAAVWARTQSAAALLLAQFGMVGLFLGFLGLVLFFERSRLSWNLLWTAIAFGAFSLLYGTRDSFVYLLPVFLCFAIWIGLALGRLMEKISHPGRYLLVIVFAVHIGVSAVHTWPSVDASRDARAEEFGQAVLAQAPPQAILLTKSDEAVFALWYFHFALGERSDVAVVASDLLHHAWYQESLRAVYPALNVRGPFPFPETIRLANPGRPACYVDAFSETQIDCLPPIE